jgi:predicted AlkP superfamily phosphohydrolase/phosphomutase
MNIVDIQSILDKALIGKIISKQPGIKENFWGSVILGVTPCDLNYGCDCGFLIYTTASGDCSFTVHNTQQIGFDN